jgi:hypothetical protein
MIDFSKTLIRCYSLGYLFTEPKSKADKDAGNLSATAKAHLIEVYASKKWGIDVELTVKAVKKGLLCEEDAITTISRLDKKLYIKNDERKENEWISGLCDIDNEPDDEIIDTKVSLDALSFLSNLVTPVDKNHEIQLNGYMWLWNRKKARVSHVLVDTPDSLIEGEKYALLRSMDVVSEESEAFKKAWERRLTNLKFNHLPIEERVINFHLYRNEEIIQQIPGKVAKAREFLAELSSLHAVNYKKDTILV